jgi:hypothetical protein
MNWSTLSIAVTPEGYGARFLPDATFTNVSRMFDCSRDGFYSTTWGGFWRNLKGKQYQLTPIKVRFIRLDVGSTVQPPGVQAGAGVALRK